MGLIETDLKILRMLMDHGQLTTRQLALVVGRKESSLRRRMRQLVPQHYIVDLGRERVCDLKLYALGPRGLEAMAQEQGLPLKLLPVATKPPSGYSSTLEPHRRLVADIRIAAHRWAQQPECPIRISCSRHEGHLSSDSKRRASKSRWDRFLVGWELADPLEPGERLGCIPDAQLVLSPKGFPLKQMSCFIEADRGTEQIQNGKIWDKFRGYFAAWLAGIYGRVPERPELSPSGMRVLFVVAERSAWRISAMRLALSKFVDDASNRLGSDRPKGKTSLRQFADVFRFALARELLAWETDFFQTPVWETAKGSKVPLFRGAPRTVDVETERVVSDGQAAGGPKIQVARGHVCGRSGEAASL